MWRWADVKMSRCERRCERRYEERWADERRCERRRERRYEDEQMWRWADVREDMKMSRCEDEQMWEKMWRWADVKMSRCERRCEDEQMWRWADVKMRRCEDEKVRYRPPLLEEPCAQTLSGKMLGSTLSKLPNTKIRFRFVSDSFQILFRFVSDWEVLCADFAVQSSSGKCFVQALQYRVVLGSTLRKPCNPFSMGSCFCSTK